MVYNFLTKSNFDAIRIKNNIKNNNYVVSIKTRGKLILIDLSNIDDNIISHLKKYLK